MNFELAHQRVQLQGKVAETESRAAIEVEAAKEKVSKGGVLLVVGQWNSCTSLCSW